GYLFNPFGKTKAAKRKIPLTSMALAIVKRRAEAAKGVYLFPHKKDKNKPMLKVNNAHTTALKNSQVLQFRLYDLRHTWATRAVEAGTDPTTLATLLGHSKLNMVMRYVHPQEQHQADVVKKIEAFKPRRKLQKWRRGSEKVSLHSSLQLPKINLFLTS